MGEITKIEWCDHTFNPWWGCAKVSTGCDHCYAENQASRFGTMWGVDSERRQFGEKHWNEPRKWNEKAKADGVRRRVFCASMADVFDKNAPLGARQKLLSLIADTPHLDWLLLTKRIGNAERMLKDACQHDGRLMDANDRYHPLPNIWLGISVVNQEEADRDIPKLLQVPAAVRFLSMEPLLGPVDLTRVSPTIFAATANMLTGKWKWENGPTRQETPGLDWVIVGGESGHNARPMSPDWVRRLRDQCAAVGVPFLFKQWGEWLPMLGQAEGIPVGKKTTTSDGWVMGWAGKKAAGRLIDGVQHDGYPLHQNCTKNSEIHATDMAARLD